MRGTQRRRSRRRPALSIRCRNPATNTDDAPSCCRAAVDRKHVGDGATKRSARVAAPMQRTRRSRTRNVPAMCSSDDARALVVRTTKTISRSTRSSDS
jgi:hypothetical protein